MMIFFANCVITLLLLCGSDVLASSHPYIDVFNILPEPETKPVSENATYRIIVNLTSSLHECQTRFLSVTIDTYSVKVRWKEFDFGSEKLQNLAAALSPSDIRLGGTYADFLIFDPNATESDLDKQQKELIESSYKYDSGIFDPAKYVNNFTMTASHWDNFTQFVSNAGWDLMFDFNLFVFKHDLWDTTNAELLLNYSSEKGVKIPYFQLGNEPNSYKYNFNFTISPETLAKDFWILKSLISKYPLYNTSGLFGPDVTNLNIPHHGLEYLSEFISSGAYNFISGITLHHYYFRCVNATEEEFLNISIFDSLKSELTLAVETVKTSPLPLPILLTETSTCSGGGAPDKSDTFMAGFLWLDKLGLAAQFGVSRVFRQTFHGGAYGLLDSNLMPYPDYYLSVLFKRLIEGPVFSVSTEPVIPLLRVYAHCARNKIYQAGALVIYFLNLRDTATVLDLPQFKDADLDLYLLTPGDEKGLLSSSVKLNGNLLIMRNWTLPPLLPRSHKGEVKVDALSFGFIVVPHSNVTLCNKYFANSANNNN